MAEYWANNLAIWSHWSWIPLTILNRFYYAIKLFRFLNSMFNIFCYAICYPYFPKRGYANMWLVTCKKHIETTIQLFASFNVKKGSLERIYSFVVH